MYFYYVNIAMQFILGVILIFLQFNIDVQVQSGSNNTLLYRNVMEANHL